MLSSLAIAAVTDAIPMPTSAEQVPYSHRVVPRYLTLVTSSNFWPLMLISALMFVLLAMILLFSVVTSIQFAVAPSTSLFMRFRSSLLLPPTGSMSSANCGLHAGLPPMEMNVKWTWSVSCMIVSRNKLNRMDESKHH